MHPALYNQVIEWLPPNARVLDLGTGDGAFLERLVKTRKVRAEGVERESGAESPAALLAGWWCIRGHCRGTGSIRLRGV